jgi:hypothetical protein
MLKLILITIIIYIIIEHMLNDNNCVIEKLNNFDDDNTCNQGINKIKPMNLSLDKYFTDPALANSYHPKRDVSNYNDPAIISKNNMIKQSRPIVFDDGYNEAKANSKEGTTFINSKPASLTDMAPRKINRREKEDIEKEWLFERPNPWNKITLNETDEYPYKFNIKLKIPSLNDYDAWKQVVPNLEFEPRGGNLIIPSKDEASALALANLISSNFGGHLTLQDILEKNLIQISIAKAQSHEIVQHKLREQIMENLFGKSFNKVQNNYEKDLVKNNISNVPTQTNNGRVDFKTEKFTDTFEHFGANNNKTEDIEAYDGNDFSSF